MATKKTKARDFEQALSDLETVVDQLENGDLSLEDSLKQFEQGVQLVRSCQTALQKAEQKVEILLEKTPEAAPEDFEPED